MKGKGAHNARWESIWEKKKDASQSPSFSPKEDAGKYRGGQDYESAGRRDREWKNTQSSRGKGGKSGYTGATVYSRKGCRRFPKRIEK